MTLSWVGSPVLAPGTRGHYAKLNKSDIERNTVWYRLYMESKKEDIHINREKLVLARGENGGWEIG